MKIRPVEAELFHADGQTDGQADWHDEANSRCSQLSERAWKYIIDGYFCVLILQSVNAV